MQLPVKIELLGEESVIGALTGTVDDTIAARLVVAVDDWAAHRSLTCVYAFSPAHESPSSALSPVALPSGDGALDPRSGPDLQDVLLERVVRFRDQYARFHEAEETGGDVSNVAVNAAARALVRAVDALYPR